MTRETLEAAAAAAGSKVTYTGAGASVVSWIFSSEFGVIFGILLGLAGLLVNWYFKRRTDQREHAEHLARMRKLAVESAPVGLHKYQETDE
ncbi:holin [Variovorax sp. dw_954]|uniref:holin n=1 Tax=Variovorax sp. dw_954 TaxID=2720078 RepID=UPI001BD3A7C1|nr:holin [Variovorax sp. dw_954]